MLEARDRVGGRVHSREIAGDLGEAVHLGTPVERIAHSPHGVTAAVGGAVLDADAAAIAVPATVLGRIAFDPPLPGWKADAVTAVRHGQAAKLFLPLARPSAPSATLSVPGRFWTYTQLDPAGAPLPVACSFAGSPPAVERLDHSTWPDLVRELRPDLDFEAGAEPVLSSWADDPWALAAYSAHSLAHPPDDAALAARWARSTSRASTPQASFTR